LEKDKVKLQELDKLKSAFLANMSHELRTPMNTIIGYTEALLDRVDGPVNEEQERSLNKVKSGAKHLLRLIDDLLSVSKMEAEAVLNMKELKVREFIYPVIQSFEPLAAQKGLVLTLDLQEDLPPVYGDEDKIGQILANLISNAVKFTHEGHIIVKVRTSLRGLKPGETPGFLEICVEDTGIGIEEEDLARIFDEFVQVDFTLIRQYGGAGIGLSVARRLVVLHGGEIWVRSKYGEGSTFCFTLPLKKKVLEQSDVMENQGGSRT
jgi:signal transduction histidine kinase